MGWLIALGILVAVLLVPLGIGARYDTHGPAAWATVGPVRIPLYPTRAPKEKKEPKKETRKGSADSSGGSFTDFLPIVQDVIALLADLRGKLLVSRMECKLNLAGGDPCDLAVNYGRAWAILGSLVPQLERIFRIKKRDISVSCDFEGDVTTVYFLVHGRITLGRLLAILCVHGSSILRKYHSIISKRKGGTTL